MTIDLGDLLAQIAAALDVPVFILAVLLLVAIAVELGRFGAEAWRRRGRSTARALRELVRTARAHPDGAARLSAQAPTRIAAAAVRDLAAPGDPEHALADFELAVQRRLDRTRLLVRAGPALGLMGTLIPLAPGLEALGGGDVAKLADDLRQAFGATVVGLLVGTIAFALTLARTRMYTEDLAALERGAADPLVTAPPPSPTTGVVVPRVEAAS